LRCPLPALAAGSDPVAPASSAAGSEPGQSSAESGIYGAMVSAWGNAPANPRTYECVKIFDASGQRLITRGVCSGMYAQFRIPLAPGRYLADYSQLREPRGIAPKAQPGSRTVDVSAGQWVNLAPKPPAAPVP